MDILGRDANLYYTIFSNQMLWPLLHNFPDKIVIRRDAYAAYRRVNREIAHTLSSMLRPHDLIWVHDYHLIPLGEELRELGWKGKIGFFLHVPFPPADTFSLIPWARDLLENHLAYDLVGLHIRCYVHNLFDTLAMELRGA